MMIELPEITEGDPKHLHSLQEITLAALFDSSSDVRMRAQFEISRYRMVYDPAVGRLTLREKVEEEIGNEDFWRIKKVFVGDNQVFLELNCDERKPRIGYLCDFPKTPQRITVHDAYVFGLSDFYYGR